MGRKSFAGRDRLLLFWLLIMCLLAFTGPSLGAADELGPATLADHPMYRLTPSRTLERSEDGGVRWFDVRGLPQRVLPEDRAGEPLPVTAFAFSPSDSRVLLAAVGNRLFHSTSSGAAWNEIDVTGLINSSTYVTAVAVEPGLRGAWAVGTSYDGLYITRDQGQTWSEIGRESPRGPFYQGAGFYDEIDALAFEDDGSILVRADFGGGFAAVDPDGSVERLRPVAHGPAAYRASPAWPSTQNGVMTGRTSNAPAHGVPAPTDALMQRAANRTGIYIAAANATQRKMPGYFDLMDRYGYNSLVVDVKDDLGRITYETQLALPREVGSVFVQVDLETLISRAHDRGIYVIARLVLFKDRELARFEGGRLSLWDSRRQRPWGVFVSVTDEETGENRVVQVEHWVDPYSAEVREYNLDIAAEVAAMGVDEVQFDYVRFPSDGDTSTLESRFAPAGADRVQALESFLSAARDRLDVPIGIDVFGFNAWARMSYLGQDIERLAPFVDVISPMFYPSHFARSFLPDLSYLDRSRVIYETGTARARAIAGGHTLVRPYVQAFLIGHELNYEPPEFYRYLDLQLEGLAAAQADGFTLWNASGRYYMLR